ncbi:MAG: adenylate/guanylate cyclase domain-containing protein, partial [Rhodobacteraceae bacterium]|nr:adenylate/guanylate cyclase domain-containing protein [Paracoccaceae bacterium]
VPPIIKAGGTVDKYLGDGLLAVFETADEKSSAVAALQAAQGIRNALAEFNLTLISEKQAEVQIGIGIHLGDVVLGEIGAAGNAPRTLIGDTVNAASRLEGQTKELGVDLLVSDAVLIGADISTDGLDLVRLALRGVTEPVNALAVPRQVLLETALLPKPVETEPTPEPE